MAITAYLTAAPKNTPEFIIWLAYTWFPKEPFHRLVLLRVCCQCINGFGAIKSLEGSLCYEWRLFSERKSNWSIWLNPFLSLWKICYLITWCSTDSAPTFQLFINSRKIHLFLSTMCLKSQVSLALIIFRELCCFINMQDEETNSDLI